MTLMGWLQIGLMVAAVALVVKPLGIYMARVFSGERTLLAPVLGPVESLFYGASGVDAKKEQGWLGYTLAMLAFSIAGFVSLYLMQSIVTRMLGRIAGWAFVAMAAGLCSFGIYLGRFLRFNSWDVIAKPGKLAASISSVATGETGQPHQLAFLALFATFLFIAYVMLYALTHCPRQLAGRLNRITQNQWRLYDSRTTNWYQPFGSRDSDGALAAVGSPGVFKAGKLVFPAYRRFPQGSGTCSTPPSTVDRSEITRARITTHACQQRRVGFHGTQLSRLVTRQYQSARPVNQARQSRNYGPDYRRDHPVGTTGRNHLLPDVLCQNQFVRGAAGPKLVHRWRNRLDAGRTPHG